jgi:hypothetical protein
MTNFNTAISPHGGKDYDARYIDATPIPPITEEQAAAATRVVRQYAKDDEDAAEILGLLALTP